MCAPQTMKNYIELCFVDGTLYKSSNVHKRCFKTKDFSIIFDF